MSAIARPDFVDVLDHGIHVIDTGFHRPRFDAAYLIVEKGRAAFVDTGTNHAVPRLLAALDAAGLAPEAVDMVIADPRAPRPRRRRRPADAAAAARPPGRRIRAAPATWSTRRA